MGCPFTNQQPKYFQKITRVVAPSQNSHFSQSSAPPMLESSKHRRYPCLPAATPFPSSAGESPVGRAFADIGCVGPQAAGNGPERHASDFAGLFSRRVENAQMRPVSVVGRAINTEAAFLVSVGTRKVETKGDLTLKKIVGHEKGF